MKANIANNVVIILSIITTLNFILLIINNVRVKKYKNLYEKALSKFNRNNTIKDEFNNLYDRLDEIEKSSHDTVDMVNNFGKKIQNNVQKIGLVKYNAYDETENKLSFALVLLDENGNGILINHIYSKYGSSIYVKLVAQGIVEDRISEEEEKALKIALEDKDFKDRKVLEVVKTRKRKNNK